MKRFAFVLPVIVFCQFCCTSLWFASNGVLTELIANFNLGTGALGHLTSAVQFGFIAGTLSFAVLTITDRFSPSKVFFVCACLGAIFNLGVLWEGNNLSSILALRVLTGFCLAGIYPVGMKIAADYFERGLGKSLGYLVGALVIGTALPHLLRQMTSEWSWKVVLVAVSGLALLGGVLLVTMVADGPHRKPGQRPDFTAFFSVFKVPTFRSAAFGYFGHMWELYAFWAFVPVMLQTYVSKYSYVHFDIPLLSFLIIAVGGIACVLGGYLSQQWGPKRVAFWALLLSGVCCVLSPLIFSVSSPVVFVGFLLFWGMAVIADSPLFSTLVAQNCDAEKKGTALTIVNGVGFAITIVSIQLLGGLTRLIDPQYLYLVLAIGPFLGLVALRRRG